MFTAIKAVKLVVSGVVGIGTGKIVGGVIKNHVTPENLVDKVTVTAASWVIAAMATKATKDYTGEMIDETVGGVVTAVQEIKLAQKLERIRKGESSFEQEGMDVNDFEIDKASGKYKKVEKTETAAA